MSETNLTALEDAVIAAAAGLSTVLYNHREWEQWHDAKTKEKAAADAALRTSARHVAEADLALAQARCRVVTIEDALISGREAHVKITEEYNAARVHLWTITMTNDRGTILAASRDYGAKALRFHQSRMSIGENEVALDEANATVTRCTEAQRQAVRDHESAAATVEALARDLASRPRPEHENELFKFEDALVDATHLMTNTEQAKYAYSNVEAGELLGCD